MTLQAALIAIVLLGAAIAIRETLHILRRNRRGRP
jgi:hypothetical protein